MFHWSTQVLGGMGGGCGTTKLGMHATEATHVRDGMSLRRNIVRYGEVWDEDQGSGLHRHSGCQCIPDFDFVGAVVVQEGLM